MVARAIMRSSVTGKLPSCEEGFAGGGGLGFGVDGKGVGTSGAVAQAEIERVRVVGFPGREDMGQAGDGKVKAPLGVGAEPDCCGFEEGGWR